MIERRDVFQAIADPTRRAIIHMLSGKSHNLSSVVDHFDVSRPAIAKHLRILIECGLVDSHEDGRERFFHAKLQRLREVSDWTDHYRIFWSKKLDDVGSFLDEPEERPTVNESLKKFNKRRK